MLSIPTVPRAVLVRPRTAPASDAPAEMAGGARIGLSRKAPFSLELTGVVCPQPGVQRRNASLVQLVGPVMGPVTGGAVDGYFLAGARIPATGLPRGAPV